MREISLAGAIDAIQSRKHDTRREGLDDLEHVLKASRNDPKAHNLSDADFRSLIETLTAQVTAENDALVKATKKQQTSKAKTSVAKNSAASRLADCSYAIRITVEIGVASLSYKTVSRSLFDHIIQELSNGTGEFQDALLDDHFKTLLVVLTHRPHLEHLSDHDQRWSNLVSLCCDALKHINETTSATQDVATALVNRSAARSRQPSRASTPALSNDASVSNGQSAVRTINGSHKGSDDVALCLEKLMSVHHLPILGTAEEVLDTVDRALRPTISTNRVGTQTPCLTIINTILFEAMTENIPLAIKALSSALFFIRRHWGSLRMAQALQEQMLISLIRGQALFPALINTEGEASDLSDLDGLLDRLMTEYRNRLLRNMLSSHDIELEAPLQESYQSLFSMKTCFVKGKEAAESSWAQLAIIADLFGKLRIGRTASTNGDSKSTSAKKRKLENPLFSLVSAVTTAKQEEIVASLQFLTFILGSVEIPADQLQSLVDKLFPLLTRDNGEVSNWSTLALAMVGQQAAASEASTNETSWQQILSIAISRFSTHRVSRFSCYLADIVLQNELVTFAEASDGLESLLTAVDVSGPALLDEASSGLWRTILGLYNIHRAASYDSVLRNVLRWFFAAWRPSQSGLSRKRLPSVKCIAELLSVILGDNAGLIAKSGRRVLHPLSRARLSCLHDHGLATYLLARGDTAPEPERRKKLKFLSASSSRPSTKASKSLLVTICDYFLTEADALLSAYNEASQTSMLSIILVRESLTICIVALGLHETILSADMTKADLLLRRATELRDRTASAYSSPGISPDRFRTMIETLYNVFEDFRILPSISFKSMSVIQVGVLRVARKFGTDFWRSCPEEQRSVDDNETEDLMSIDESQKSRTSRVLQAQALDDLAHDWLCAYTDNNSYQASIRADLCFASELPEQSSLTDDEDGVLPRGLVEYVNSLNPFQFLATRPFLDDIYKSKLHIRRSEGAQLLIRAAEIFELYELERSETAMGACIDLMAYTVKQWVLTEIDDDLADAASQLYGYFLKAVRHKLVTPHVSTAMANMLQRVIKSNSEYGHSDGLPSARTSLFQILASGTAKVKFGISQTVSAVFGLFILREHDSILDDIEASIPHDPDCLSITAVRLFLLSRLAASWSTLIRRCIYSIVEATGLWPEVMPYARSCLEYLGKELGIENSHDLFKLFVSQILYTWLETRDLSSLPYAIFDYKSLRELINDCSHEIAAQLIMRGKESEIDTVAQAINVDFSELLNQAFGKCAAYCIARDTAIAPDIDPQAANAAVRLRKHVGKDQYKNMISEQFPEIVATFFRIVDREDQITKGFQKHKRHAAAHEAFESMLQSGASQNTPPVSQQPSFKSTCLLDELEYVCDRSPYDLNNLWTPALYLYVFRSLLENIQPALGPLHAAAVVRRIRILVSMGGKIATAGYCLEMALGALRPYLDNTHSAEDVMGLYHYLLASGKAYLANNLTFLGGFAVSVLASLKAFMDRPQESTTQQSVFRATLTKAQEFHQWITNFTLELQAASQSSDTAHMRKMVESASQLRGHGSSRIETPEGELLFQVLRDKAVGRHFLDEPSTKQIMTIVSRNFRYSGDRTADILGQDEYATSLAPTAWEYFEPETASPAFNLWIIRALGRSYASTGFIQRSFRRENPVRSQFEEQTPTPKFPARASSIAIIADLYRVVCNSPTTEAGIAERTIQSIITRADVQNELQELVAAIPQKAMSAMNWREFYPPTITCPPYQHKSLREALIPRSEVSIRVWTRDLCLSLIDNATLLDEFLSDLKPALVSIPTLAEQLLPCVLHLVLVAEAGKAEETKSIVSSQIKQMMSHYIKALEPQFKQMIQTIIYLRSQPLPFEKTKMDRSYWLGIDYRLASDIAMQCKMYKTALLFLEIALSTESKSKGSRRSNASTATEIPTEKLLEIFQNVDENDSYYGVRQPSSLGSMMERLDHEGAGFKSLAFRGMAFDAEIRQNGEAPRSTKTLVRNLNDMQFSGLSNAIASNAYDSNFISSDATFDAARKLEKWDIPTPEAQNSPAVNLYQAFQNLHSIHSTEQVVATIDSRLEATFPLKAGILPDIAGSFSFWSSIAALVEMEELLSARSPDQLQKAWLGLEKRRKWMESTRFEVIDRILSSRETLLSVLSKSPTLQSFSRSSPKEVRQLQIQALLSSSSISRVHRNLQKSLSAATAIEQLLPMCEEVGLNIEAAARLEASNVLWDYGEMAPSIQMLRDIFNNLDLRRQDIHVGRPDILAKLASRISEARVEQPDQILSSYLDPALKELRGNTVGEEAGQVFHEFASFCDKQLQDADSLEDFDRVRKMRDGKLNEVHELDEMIKSSSPSKERDSLKAHRSKAKMWFDLDNAEFKRLKNGRDALLRQSLDMYLMCLKACDAYDRDAMRFSALWLAHYDDEAANGAVKKHLSEVSSSKFANLMNQWTSRLLDEEEQSNFQAVLWNLVVRICGDHPYHAMYNIFVSSKSRGGKDATSLSRHAAANKIVARFKEVQAYGSRWITVHNACVNYQRFAVDKSPDGGKWKQGMKCQLRKIAAGPKLEQDVVALRVPPPTMKIALRKDGNYQHIPAIVKWSSEFSIASGLSAPKIITAIASDGQKYKMLFKAGNDDPRQDAIMEQVFEQVSELLQAHRETRQRKLGIRSYKVLPLTHTSGVIEFVQNTIPLHDYLIPAHQDHYPNDLKNHGARKIIQDAAQSGRGNEHRIKEYKRVCEKFQPVLRFFFMERFENPDDWFEKRLAYTRTTAAISMLGHVLGLGDRHGHNILLDEKTGEVVHIDLGIAFEQGRVLPVPELVPFRLTRDIVDGMGITKTEGVFRRCCEFTLDALRKESWGIMTILDVLRYDPLYSWSISPLRLRRLQGDKSQGDDETSAEDGVPAQAKTERKDNEEAEADRALTVVNKKLSKSLSVEATVNQLIQQATDEKNLALLFAGWAAYI